MWSIKKYFKKYLLYSFMALLIMLTASGSVSAQASVSLSPDSYTGLSTGDTFVMDVDIDSGVEQLNAVNVKMNYDPDMFQVNSITKGYLFGDDMLTAPGSGDDGQGNIVYGFAVTGEKYAPGSGTLISVEFQVLGTTEGVYDIGFEEVRLLDKDKNDLNGQATGALVVVGSDEVDPSTPKDSIDLGNDDTGSSSSSSSSSSYASSLSSEELGYNYIFGSNPDGYKVMDRYGASPQGDELSQDMQTFQTELITELEQQYLFPRGKVVSIGSNSAGYIVVAFHEPLMPERSEMDGLYSDIEITAKESGIDSVPVEFGEGTIPEVSERLQELLGRIQAMESTGLEVLMDNESSSYDPMILATAGTIPQIDTEKECWQWYFKDSYAISLNVSDEIDTYLQNGSVLSTGLSGDGYFEVRVGSGTEIDRRSLINDIYELMNKEALNVGVSEVPVVFKLGDSGENEEILTSVEEEASEELPEASTEGKETPGFSFYAGILSLTMVFFLKGSFKGYKK